MPTVANPLDNAYSIVLPQSCERENSGPVSYCPFTEKTQYAT
jgi:hypothetical protein